MILTHGLHTISHKLRSAGTTGRRCGEGKHYVLTRNTIATDDKRQPAGAATTAKSSAGVVGAGTLNGKYGSSRQALETKEEAQQFSFAKDRGEKAA